LLERAVSRERQLRVRLLAWDFSMVYALERDLTPLFSTGWHRHRRVDFRLDNQHPFVASHHQEIVVVDDALAFVGGLDIAKDRWDASEHRCDDPRRRDPAGRPYPPFHDVQMAVDGAAAAALGDLVRERWQRATGKRVASLANGDFDPWPGSLTPDFWWWTIDCCVWARRT
jgi:phosphatidylserine/phosphatidylglycerophosphate/cardiolipin synthase-like enzyme